MKWILLLCFLTACYLERKYKVNDELIVISGFYQNCKFIAKEPTDRSYCMVAYRGSLYCGEKYTTATLCEDELKPVE